MSNNPTFHTINCMNLSPYDWWVGGNIFFKGKIYLKIYMFRYFLLDITINPTAQTPLNYSRTIADEALYYSTIYPNSRDLGTAE